MKRLLILIVLGLLFQFAKAAPALIANFQTPRQSGNTQELRSEFAETADTIRADTVTVPMVDKPDALSAESRIYKRRLDSLTKQIPLDFNEYVQSYINIYARNKEEMAHVLGLTKYYFPIYEKAFHDAGVPDELKYLSVVESKLDPYSVSRVGATGPWQFMYTTAKVYGLLIDRYIDERRDPIQASYAAARYLKESFAEFGDWLLAIASYNCGTSNVERAIRKAGGAKDFWSIRRYLPTETRNYVPAYIAIAYVMNCYQHLDIVPQTCAFSVKTDTVLVNKTIALSAIAKVLQADPAEITILNPAYKKQIINGTDAAPRRLVIPKVDNEKFSALFEALNNPEQAVSQQDLDLASNRDSKSDERPRFHKVKHGETLREIANNYGIEVQDLKAWNHLKSNKAKPGEKLKLSGRDEETTYASVSAKHHGSHHLTYKVKTGDTLSGIAERFDASVESIKELNGLRKGKLQPGMKIRI